MARNGTGTFNLVAGNPVVSGTTIQSAWANSTLSDIASGLTQSLSRDGQAAMTGPLPMGGQAIQNASTITANGNINGGAFIPTLSTIPSNGMYFPAANTIGFATNSALAFSIDAVGNVISVGNHTGAALIPTGSVVPVNGMYLPAANTVGFASNTTLRASVNSTGNWSLVAPSSGNTIAVAQVNSAYGLVSSAATVAQVAIAGNGSVAGTASFDIVQDGSNVGSIINRANAALNLSTNNIIRVTIAATGGVTVGVPTSGTALTVTAVAGAAALAVSGGNGSTITSASGVALAVTGVNANAIATFSGTTGAGFIAVFDGQAGTRQWRIGSGQSATGAFDVVDSTAGNLTRLTIPTTGGVSIPTPTSGSSLTANIIANTANAFALNDGTSNFQVITDAAHNWVMGPSTSSTSFRLRASNQDAITIGTNGAVTIAAPTTSGVPLTMTATSGVAPFTANGSGATSASYAQIYEPLYGAAVKAAATRDTGTFTVTITGCTTSPTGTATWSRSGDNVVLSLPAVTATSNATSYTLTGLPAAITPATLTHNCSANTFADNSVTGVSAYLQIAAGTGTITMFRLNSSTGWTAAGTKGMALTTVAYSLI